MGIYDTNKHAGQARSSSQKRPLQNERDPYGSLTQMASMAGNRKTKGYPFPETE